MLRVPPHFLDCTVYLYDSVQSAEKSAESGGSGFLVHVMSTTLETVGHAYAVTNKHVLDGGGHVLRINNRSGGFETLPTKPDQWFTHIDGDDLAVFPITMSKSLKWNSVSISHFVTEELVNSNAIGPGDDIFMVGRLITRDGKQFNKPVVRFGHLAMMRDAIKREDGERQESFLVDCRSLSGFSGSPVFVSTGGTLRVAANDGSSLVPHEVEHVAGIWLLGIDWCHIPLWQPVYGEKKNVRSKVGLFVEQNTGIAGVIPAWRLKDLLMSPQLVEQRATDEKSLDPSP